MEQIMAEEPPKRRRLSQRAWEEALRKEEERVEKEAQYRKPGELP
jgi:hypothetical protein